MTETIELKKLKAFAKRYARANCIALHRALNLIAAQLGFANWVKLRVEAKNGWLPDAGQMTKLDVFVRVPLPAGGVFPGDSETMQRRLAYLEESEQGMIDGHAYRLEVLLNDVIIAGERWSIVVPEDPAAVPLIETYTAPENPSPVMNPDFVQSALKIARERAAQVKAAIAREWPRRSTKPDNDGVVRHPLGRAESATWFCLHCESRITGHQIARNMWHCPGCGASPIDIFETAFWAEDGGISFLPVKPRPAVAQDAKDVRITDSRPRLDLSHDKIELLIRSALHDDAATVSEQLGAIHAEITIDDDGSVYITLDADLWPEDKEPAQAMAVAELLDLELDVDIALFTTPFAWPELGKFTSNTSEYVTMMLDAYRQYRGVSRDGE